MPDLETARTWGGRTMVDRDGDRIGKIESIYVDDQTGEPQWALVDTGLSGSRAAFVPLARATERGDQVQVPHERGLVEAAPVIAGDEHLSEEEEGQLRRHYSLEAAAGGAAGGDDAMTRSEEELRVGTQARERGRVRLRKYVTTEQVTQTVPVQREEVRVEREPITDANVDAATSGPEISESEHEVTLHGEEPVVEKRVVPRERVRLDKDTVTDEREVAEEVRKEQIDLDDDR